MSGMSILAGSRLSEGDATVTEEMQERMAEDVAGRWSVVVVDDNPNFATLTRLWLRRDPRFRVLASGTDGAEGVALAAAFRPDLVILDDDMPIMTGLEAIAQVREASPNSKVILYSASVNVDRADLAAILGADAVVSKLDPISTLIRTAVTVLTSS